MANLIEFKLENGESAFMQVEESDAQKQARQRVSRGSRGADEEETLQAPRSFNDAIQSIAPIGNALLTSLKDINTPDEISLEFGISFSGEAGIIFSSVKSNASFKVNVKWKNPQGS